jgi:hypothetical protein
MIWLKINFKMEQEGDHNTGTSLRSSNIIMVCICLYLSSLRNLCRALQFARDYGDSDVRRSLYEVTFNMKFGGSLLPCLRI